jgi:hypothetical protein
VDFVLILLEQYRRTCFCSAPNTTTELSVFATVDSVNRRQTMSSVNEISVARKGDDATLMVSVPYLLLSVALRQTSSVRLAVEKTPSNSSRGSPCR